MTDKIDEAREWHKDGTLLYTLKHAGWKKGIEQFQNATTIKVEGDNAEAVAETILKALSAYEKLQGVDFDELERVIEVVNSSRVLHGVRAYYLPEDIETLENAAQTLADIKKEIE